MQLNFKIDTAIIVSIGGAKYTNIATIQKANVLIESPVWEFFEVSYFSTATSHKRVILFNLHIYAYYRIHPHALLVQSCAMGYIF